MHDTALTTGDIIIKEGDADRNLFKFYIVEEGEARAYVHEDGEDVLMSHLRAGERGAVFRSLKYISLMASIRLAESA